VSLFKQILLSLIVLGAACGIWYAYQNPQVVSLARETVGIEPQAEHDLGQGEHEAGTPGGPRGRGSGIAGVRGPGGAINVIVGSVAADRSEARLTALGTAKAVRAVTVFPQVTGIVEEIAFTPGEAVGAGQVLVRLDEAEQQIAVERAKVGLEEAQKTRERARRLSESRTITAVNLEEAETAARMAEIELRSAELALSRREIRAPFAGVTGLTDLAIGDLVSNATEIVSLADLTSVVVGFEVPESWAGRASVGQTISATAPGLPGSRFQGEIRAVDNRLDATSRTLGVEALLSNPRREVRPGMSLTVELTSRGEERLSVPSLAVQWDRAGAFVWKVDGDSVTRVPVEVMRRGSGFVLVDAELQDGDQVVVEGIQRLREGAEVALVDGPGLPPRAAEADEPSRGSDEAGRAAEEAETPAGAPGDAETAPEAAEEPGGRLGEVSRADDSAAARPNASAPPQPRRRPDRGRS
jgi:RND family efflux transporter MFP subunit